MNPKIPKREGASWSSQATRARRRKKRQFGSQAALCRVSACVACVAMLGPGERPTDLARRLIDDGYDPMRCEPHHEPPIGRDQKSVDADTIPLCRKHHDERHNAGAVTFWTRHGLDPEQIKAQLRARLETR